MHQKLNDNLNPIICQKAMVNRVQTESDIVAIMWCFTIMKEVDLSSVSGTRVRVL